MNKKEIELVEAEQKKWQRVLTAWRGRGQYSPGYGVRVTEKYINQSYEQGEIIEWADSRNGLQDFYQVERPFELKKVLAGYSYYREKYTDVQVVEFLKNRKYLRFSIPKWRPKIEYRYLSPYEAFEVFSWSEKLGIPNDHSQRVLKLEEFKKEKANDKKNH